MLKFSDQIDLISTALAKAQNELENADKNSANPHFKSKYADLAEILNTVRPTLSMHGLAVSQHPAFTENMVHVTTLLSHSSGQWMQSCVSSPIGKADSQGVGSAITYLRRYSLAAITGISQEDDDGNAASVKTEGKKAEKTELPEANKALYTELASYCKGDTEQMGVVLKRISHYETDGKEYFISLDRLSTTSEKWASKVLKDLKKHIAATPAE